MVIARDNVLRTVWNHLYDIVRTDSSALAAADAFLLIHYNVAIFCLGYRTGRAYAYAGTKMKTSFLACRRTALKK